jgi:hypothetical protein
MDILVYKLEPMKIHNFLHRCVSGVKNFKHVFGIKNLNTLWTGDADLRLHIITVQDGWHKSAFLTRGWFPRTIHLITQDTEPFSEWSCWQMFIEMWPHSEWMICDKYREQTALYFPLLLYSTSSQRSDFNHVTHDGKR